MTAAADLLRRATDLAARRRRLPESTYRLQFHAGFTFRDAAAIVPYLADLGITHVYASPYLKARPGSTHGYDIVDHSVLNPEIGTPDDYAAFVTALQTRRLGQILDIVPNHMGIATHDNPWWNDVLENGPASRYGAYFDIDWRASDRTEYRDRVLLPVLGDSYGEVLEAGQLNLAFDGGAFKIYYWERWFPVAPRSYAAVLGHRPDELERRLGPDDPDLIEYQSILTAVTYLPDRTTSDPVRRTVRQREKEVIKRRLGELAARNPRVAEFVAENVAIFNGTPGDPRSFDLLDDLLRHQCYRLCFWRVASDEINYRRFFDINDLAALSMERSEVFAAAHQLVFRLLADGSLDGVRIDHPDGLYDPRQYFHRLQRQYLLALAHHEWQADPATMGQDWDAVAADISTGIEEHLAADAGPGRWPLYTVAEKILGHGEPLPPDWAVHGTSGYDSLIALNGLFADPAAEAAFTRGYRELLDEYEPFPDEVYRSKRLIVTTALASELNTLARQLDCIAQKGRRSRDFTLSDLRSALREVIACFPVYRSYIADDGEVREADRRQIEVAVRKARVRNPVLNASLFRFVRDTLLLKYPDGATEADMAEYRRFAGKFQQVTSPVMAKGLEDTAFYRFNRLASLNEVGGEPGRFGTPPADYHRFNADRQANWPWGLSPLSTHDTKRSEDVRARINVLSEFPDEWFAAVSHWRQVNAGHRVEIDGSTAPDANEEYLIYQTLVGVWPLGDDTPETLAKLAKRVQEYLIKALHEAKVHSSWINPNAEYDTAVEAFVGKLLDPEAGRAFRDDFRPFQRKVSHFGLLNSLSQTLLRITAPGVPDTYQGTELWDFSLVDPDNRRPVDYDCRAKRLTELKAATAAAGDDRRGLARSLAESLPDGRAKLYLTHLGLTTRKAYPGLFADGEYLPLTVTGPAADHVFAFARRAGRTTAVVAVPRLTGKLLAGEFRLPLGDVWGDTRVSLPDEAGGWRDVLTGERHPAGESIPAAGLFNHFPVALLLANPA